MSGTTKDNYAMTKKNLKDLFIGIGMIVMSVCLWFNEHYTVEIGILIGIMTLLWLLD